MEMHEVDVVQNLTERGDTYLRAYLSEKAKNEFATSQLKLLAKFIEKSVTQRDLIQFKSIIADLEK